MKKGENIMKLKTRIIVSFLRYKIKRRRCRERKERVKKAKRGIINALVEDHTWIGPCTYVFTEDYLAAAKDLGVQISVSRDAAGRAYIYLATQAASDPTRTP